MTGIRAAEIDGELRYIYEYEHSFGNERFPCIVQACADFLVGVYYRFPLCCVWAYCRDVARDYAPGIRREYEVAGLTTTTGYVPCVKCGNGEGRR